MDWFHRELGRIMWDHCGMARTAPGLEQAMSEVARAARASTDTDVRVLGDGQSLNQSLEKAGRVDDFFELAELMCHDALHREESCGGHFREEYQTRTTRRCATTSTSPTSPPGSTPAASRSCTARSSSFQYAQPDAAELHSEAHAARVAPGGARRRGRLRDHGSTACEPDMSFLEMLDLLNEQLDAEGAEPMAFESDCREGICGSCGLMINGQAHGPQRGTATCQLYCPTSPTATYHDRAVALRRLPALKDLVVDRSRFDRVIEAGGYISVPTGSAPDANPSLVPKDDADLAMDAAACIGCGACVAACPNGAGQLFTAAKLAHLNLLPQGQPERGRRTIGMVEEMERTSARARTTASARRSARR